MPKTADPRPYAAAGAAIAVAAAVAGSLLLGIAAAMLLGQAALLHRSATRGLPREVARARSWLQADTPIELHGASGAPGAGTTDAILTVNAFGHLDDGAAREAAARDLAAALRPGGRLALLETRGTHDLALALEDLGLQDVERSGLRWSVWPPVRAVTARRPR